MKLPAWVYSIQHRDTGKTYVGLSANPKQRIKHHLWELKVGRHPVEDLQADYDRYGGNFTISLLDEVTCYDEKNKEFSWQIKLGTLDRARGYNYKDPVTKWYNRGKTHT